MVLPIPLKFLLLPSIGFDFSINKVPGEDATLSKHKKIPPELGQPTCLASPYVKGLMGKSLPEQGISSQETEAHHHYKKLLVANLLSIQIKNFKISLHHGYMEILLVL